ncbi:MAG TPA: (d)CMP kinase [Stellaceae bacterium]|nr:(d)CMP kinase [Stellaceae bacterium]
MSVVAIDGPAAAGKGTLARRLAKHFGLAYLDTGKLYRATALHVIEAGDDPADPAAARRAALAVRPDELANPRLLDEDVARASSVVAAEPGVRQALLAFQRGFAAAPPEGTRGAVLDGRDIGTVVCPDAAVKLYVTASAETRAARRVKELRDRGVESIEAAVLQDLLVRDQRDASRLSAPSKPAEDAIVLDTTHLDADAAFAIAADLVGRKLRPWSAEGPSRD